MRFLAWVGVVIVAALVIVLGAGAIIAYIRGFETIRSGVWTGAVLWVTGALLVGVGLAVILFLMTLARRTAKSIGRNDEDDGKLPRRAWRSGLRAAVRRNKSLLGSPASGDMRQRIVEGAMDNPPDLA